MCHVLKIGLCGFGNVGQAILALLHESIEFELVGVVVKNKKNLEHMNFLYPNIIFCYHLTDLNNIDVCIDFSSHEGAIFFAEECSKLFIPYITGSTGLSIDELKLLKYFSKKIPLLHDSNMSPGMSFLKSIMTLTRKKLGHWDWSISEVHHKNKKDTPSGTAIDLKKILGVEKKIESLREETHASAHVVEGYFQGESIIFKHITSDRRTFAYGALEAAKWIVNKAPGFYSMQDVFI